MRVGHESIGFCIMVPTNSWRMYTFQASFRWGLYSRQIWNGECNLFVLPWRQPTRLNKPEVHALMALIRRLSSFPIISMIIMLKIIEIIINRTFRVVALQINFPTVFERTKLGLERAKTSKITKYASNRPVQVNQVVYWCWTSFDEAESSGLNHEPVLGYE